MKRTAISSGIRKAKGQGATKAILFAGSALGAAVAATQADARSIEAAAAQEPATAALAPASEGIKDIVVTAQRRSERLEDVPAAITAITPDALDRANVVNLLDINRIASGMQINLGGAFVQPAIRGVTSLTNGPGNENSIAIYVDGFFVSDTISINTDLPNLRSIEVLKGPQGTLYGRQATGGAILINTLDPSSRRGTPIRSRSALSAPSCNGSPHRL